MFNKNSNIHVFVLGVFILVLISFASGLLGAYVIVQATPARTVVAEAKNLTTPEEQQVVTVVKQVNPSVVSITISKAITANTTGRLPLYNFPFGFNVFPDGTVNGGTDDDNDNTNTPGSTKVQVGGGTGFFVNSNGLIATNKHVVSDSDAEYSVTTSDGKEYAAKVLAVDPANDIALLQIEAQNTPAVTFGDSDALQIGQSVLAVGNPLAEYPNTVTKGVVSGLARHITAGNSSGVRENIDEVIQTDAAINPGNSGGPLVDMAGRVVGINTAIDSQGIGIGFAIPAKVVQEVVENVAKNGRVVRPFLGVRYVLLTKEIAEANKLPVSEGAYLAPGRGAGDEAVVPYSAADRAGLKEGDIITKINDTAVTIDSGLSQLLIKYQPNDEITVMYLRNDGTKEQPNYQETTTKVRLDERK